MLHTKQAATEGEGSPTIHRGMVEAIQTKKPQRVEDHRQYREQTKKPQRVEDHRQDREER